MLRKHTMDMATRAEASERALAEARDALAAVELGEPTRPGFKTEWDQVRAVLAARPAPAECTCSWGRALRCLIAGEIEHAPDCPTRAAPPAPPAPEDK